VGKPDSKNRASFALSDLSQRSLQSLKDAMRNELNLDSDPPIERVSLISASIHLNSHTQYGVGELTKFLEEQYPEKRFRPHALFLTLAHEFTRRGCSESQPAHYADLLSSRGVTSTQLVQWLADAVCSDPEELLTDVVQRLNAEQHPFHEILRIKDGWRRCVLQSTNPLDVGIVALRAQVRELLASTGLHDSLSVSIRALHTAFLLRFGQPAFPVNDILLVGTIAYEIAIRSTSNPAGELPKTRPQHETPNP
jgi:hypothetical protein